MGSTRRRVVVTGLGMVSPLGNSVDDSWDALLAGRSGAAPITQFDASGLPVRFACEVKDLDVGECVDTKAARRMDRCTHLLLAAARQAESDSGLDVASVAERVGYGDRDGARRRRVVRADGAAAGRVAGPTG